MKSSFSLLCWRVAFVFCLVPGFAQDDGKEIEKDRTGRSLLERLGDEAPAAPEAEPDRPRDGDRPGEGAARDGDRSSEVPERWRREAERRVQMERMKGEHIRRAFAERTQREMEGMRRRMMELEEENNRLRQALAQREGEMRRMQEMQNGAMERTIRELEAQMNRLSREVGEMRKAPDL